MGQPRITVREDVSEELERIRQLTRLSSISEVVAVLVFRYGQHLVETWQVNPALPEQPPAPSSTHSAPTRTRDDIEDDFL